MQNELLQGSKGGCVKVKQTAYLQLRRFGSHTVTRTNPVLDLEMGCVSLKMSHAQFCSTHITLLKRHFKVAKHIAS